MTPLPEKMTLAGLLEEDAKLATLYKQCAKKQELLAKWALRGL